MGNYEVHGCSLRLTVVYTVCVLQQFRFTVCEATCVRVSVTTCVCMQRISLKRGQTYIAANLTKGQIQSVCIRIEIM